MSEEKHEQTITDRILGLLDPPDTQELLASLTRRTKMVSASKFILIGLTVVLVASVFIIPALHEDTGGARIVFTSVETSEAEQPRMTKPHFQGLDAKDQPYNLQADIAEQQEDGRVRLESLNADITLASGTWLAFLADNGILNTDNNTLFLPEQVSVFHDSGYELRTTGMSLDLDKAYAKSTNPVEGQGPLGTLNAEGMTVDTEGGVIRFAPNVKVTLLPRG